MENAVVINNLSKEYGDFRLNHISFSVPKGCITGLIGENGAGKSTTIKAMLDMIRKDSGTIELLGMNIEQDEKEIKEQLGVVMEECHFHDSLNLRQVEKIMAAIYKNWDEVLFWEYASKFELPRDKKIKEFSKGMTMKLGIIAALSHHPKLLILDEATSGLDPVVRDEILDLLFAFIEDGEHSVLISSHITSDLDKVADYIAMLHKGRLLFMEEKDRLLEDLGVLRCGEEDFKKLQDLPAVRIRRNPFGVEALIHEKDEIRRRCPELVVDDTNIEEIMLFYVRGNEK